VTDLFPEDNALCFAAVEPAYTEVTPGWKPLSYSKLLEAHRSVVPVVVESTVSEDQLSSLAASLCKTLGEYAHDSLCVCVCVCVCVCFALGAAFTRNIYMCLGTAHHQKLTRPAFMNQLQGRHHEVSTPSAAGGQG
jgi:hypothetical protein